MTPVDEKKLLRKYKVTARKYMGDDSYSWAVFVNGRPVWTDLHRDSVDYYKRITLKNLRERDGTLKLSS